MRATSLQIHQLILAQLSQGEMRLLSLVVAVRKSLGGSHFKGDLSAAIRNALRNMVAAKTVVDEGGVYSLASAAAETAVP